MELNEVFSAIVSGTKDIMTDNGFKLVNEKEPVVTDGEHSYIDFTGEKGKIRIDVFGNQSVLYYTEVNPDEATDEDFVKASTNYFNLEEFDQRDIKSLCNEFIETIENKFGYSKGEARKAPKKPPVVKSSAVKAGSQYYDTATLASRVASLYPELKAPLNENFEKYGEVLAEEFFEDYGAAPIINTIRNGEDRDVKKLFKTLNEVYEDGSSDAQGVIAVTILGKMNNEEKLINRAK